MAYPSCPVINFLLAYYIDDVLISPYLEDFTSTNPPYFGKVLKPSELGLYLSLDVLLRIVYSKFLTIN